MIDLHCHILPGLDDGAQTIEEALEMARIAVADGITDIIATPHTHDGRYQNNSTSVIKAVNQFQTLLNQENIPLQVHPGNEVHIHVEFLENLLSSESLTLCNNQRYVLLELPYQDIPRFTDDLIYELTVAGITPIIAHPERNVLLREEPNRLADWIEQGAIAQLTAGSLLGKLGERSQKAAEMMVKHNLVHVIASDAHNTGRRRPELTRAYNLITRLTSEENVFFYMENTLAILNGNKFILRRMPIKQRKRKWFLLG